MYYMCDPAPALPPPRDERVAERMFDGIHVAYRLQYRCRKNAPPIPPRFPPECCPVVMVETMVEIDFERQEAMHAKEGRVGGSLEQFGRGGGGTGPLGCMFCSF